VSSTSGPRWHRVCRVSRGRSICQFQGGTALPLLVASRTAEMAPRCLMEDTIHPYPPATRITFNRFAPMPDSSLPPSWTERLHSFVAKARFFTVSLFLHVIILIVGSGIVIFKAYVEAPDFVAGGEFVSGNDSAPPPPE